MSKSDILKKLKVLKSHYDNGAIPVLHNHEVNPGLDKSSRENYLYFIMTCSLNFQRNSPKTWQSAFDTWSDPETNYLFFPEKVVKTKTETLRNSLMKHRLALQPNKHIDIWQRLSTTFHNHFNSDPRELMKKGEYDAIQILQIIQKDMKKNFHIYQG